jgi:hypothetical protein
MREAEILMSHLRDRFRGRPAAVLGGGPSLPSDLERIPDNALKIAVNYHALKLVKAEFMVFNDDPESDPLLFDAVTHFHGVRVSPVQKFSHVAFDVPVWTGSYSSNTAAWLALWMGCNPTILCGMDCFQGDRVYFHDYALDKEIFHYPLENHLRPWKEDGRNLLPNVKRLKAASGPLADVFGLYQGEQIC